MPETYRDRGCFTIAIYGRLTGIVYYWAVSHMGSGQYPLLQRDLRCGGAAEISAINRILGGENPMHPVCG